MSFNPEISRRSALGLAAAGIGAALAPAASARPASAAAHGAAAKAGVGYGELVSDPAGLLDLPRGFSYNVLAVSGNSGNPIPATTLTDGGELSPSRYDGSASFPAGKGYAIITNHENGDGVNYPVAAPVPHRAGLTYDSGAALGGTTTIMVSKQGERLGEVVSLAGTYSNCAGGKTPWGTWLTCEETEAKAGSYTTAAGQSYTLNKDHGYVFEVHPTDMAKNRNPKPIKAFGRFAHEGIVVDPKTYDVYMTEDAGRPDGLFYKWASEGTVRAGSFRSLADDAGTLYAMSINDRGTHVTDLAVYSELGTTLDIGWVKVQDRDARTTSVRKQFTEDQVTRSHKLEGAWWDAERGGFYFDASFDKAHHDGQVWFFDVTAGTISLEVYFPLTADQDVDPDGPDNLTVNPHGGLILCEDGDGKNGLVDVDLEGNWAFLARNRQDSEMAGANFSEDGKILFANSQDPGVVFAITGPWKSRRAQGGRGHAYGRSR